MVLVTLYHSYGSVYVCCLPARKIGKGIVVVTLDVRFIHDIDSEKVGYRIHFRVIRIVACTYCVDVETLEHQHVLDHTLGRNGFS